MEGKNEKVESREIQEVNIPKRVDVTPKEISMESKEEYPGEEYPGEEYPEGEDTEEDYQGESYPEGEYEEDYDDEEGESDEDWEAETGGSDQVPLGGLYGLFKKVLKEPDTTRVSNLTNEELGVLPISVRGAQWIALIAKTFRHKGVANFFDQQANLITTSAMARKGWFSELFITSKSYASRESGSSVRNLPQSSKKNKWRVFSDKERQPIQEPIQ